MSDWNSAQYSKFVKERTQPSLDLISRISNLEPDNILDIGCGPGNSTAALEKAFPNAQILGVDSSEDMLGKARASHPDIRFEKCLVPDGLTQLREQYDLIFSNACIHWIPGQVHLLQTIFSKMKPGATLAIQIPLTQKAPFYQSLYRLVDAPQWKAKLGSIHNFHNLQPEEYYDLLTGLAADFNIWETTYYHRVASVQAVIEWYKGSGLRPYLDALDSQGQAALQEELLHEMEKTYHTQKDGTVILKMPRMFFTATKGK